MLIDEWMVHPVHTVKPLDTLAHARKLMERHRVNQLPVIRDRQLVGIVTDRDLRDAFPSVFEEIAAELARDLGRRPRRAVASDVDPSKATVELVMSRNVVTLSPRDTVEEAARLMRFKRIGALPIVDHGELVGVLTRSDVLDAFLGVTSSMAEASGA